jgi:cyclomaltodextrinase / maltogenic alpha-amylase / neopullulanase
MVSVQTPDWVKDAVFYQIFPDRFAYSEALRASKPSHLEPWDTPTTPFGYKGGDLLGVAEHLDHIQDLGATAIYFCPIFQATANHRYHTHDYYVVDPLLGGNAAFRKLLDDAHRRGMRVVLDGVFNHVSRGFFYFNDILENERNSPYLDWFSVNGFPLNAYDESRPPRYAAWWGLRQLPRLNTANPGVREYVMKIAEYWLRQGIDGWRLDVPQEITAPGFWEEFRTRVKAINREAYLVGEIWGEAISFLQGDRFDGVMNYLFTAATLAFVGGDRIVPALVEGRGYNPLEPMPGAAYADRLNRLLGLYPWEIQLTQLNLLDSHDTARAVSIFGGDAAGVRLATLLLMTFPGAPCIFAGDEIGQEGGLPDFDTRRTFPWDRPESWKYDVLAYHRELSALRRAHRPLRRGTFQSLCADDDTIVFARRFSGEVLIVAANRGAAAQWVEVPVNDLYLTASGVEVVYPRADSMPWGHFQSGGSAGRVVGGKLALNLAPRSGVVLKAA